MIVLAVGLVTNGINLLLHSMGVWFWADDWDLLFLRGNIPQYNQGLFVAHNSHWLSAHILVYRAIFTIFGMRSYTPYAFVEICMHLTIVIITYLLLRRVRTSQWVAVLSALMVAFYGLGANAEIYAASMNHVGALLFGLLAALFLVSETLSEHHRNLRASVALTVSLTFGLTSLAMLVLAGVLLLSTGGWRRAARVLGAPVAVFATWLLAYGRRESLTSIGPDVHTNLNIAMVPNYVWTGLTGTLGDGSGLTGSGPVLTLLLLAALLFARNQPPLLVQLAWAGVAADIFQLTIVAVARFNFGANQLGTSHYSYINIVLLTPAVALVGTTLASQLRGPRWRTALVVAVVFVAYAANGVTSVQKWQRDFTYVSAGGQGIALAIAADVANRQKVLTDNNRDPFDKFLVPKYVGTPQIRAALPRRSPSPQALITADSEFFTGVGARDYGLARPHGVTPYSGFSRPFAAGCQRRTPTVAEPVIAIRTGELGNEIVVWSNSTTIKTLLRRGAVAGPLLTWKARPGAMHIATSAKDADLYVSFNGTGPYTICVA